MTGWREALERDGIVCVDGVMALAELDQLIEHLSPLVGSGAGDRRLHEDEVVRRIACSKPLAELAAGVLGTPVVARVLYFDKLEGANWKVPYHQDVTIAVRERIDAPGFGGWSTKAGLTHVRAPAEVLNGMVAVRLHLDDCGEQNGPLRAIPGTHKSGVLPKSEVASLVIRSQEQIYCAPRGAAILMRPLTLHASSQATAVAHRRVLHIEYAMGSLPACLEWALGYPCLSPNAVGQA